MTSPWTAPPARPLPYGFRDRCADLWCGWRDGLKGIPRLHPLPPPAPDPDPSIDADGPVREAEAVFAMETGTIKEPLTGTGPEPLSTPRIDKIRSDVKAAIESEYILLHDSIMPLEKKLAFYRTEHDSAPDRMRVAAEDIETRRAAPSDHDLRRRRAAEQDPATHPEELIRLRRADDHRRRLREARGRFTGASRDHSEAGREAAALEEFIAYRRTVARAAARRIRDRGAVRIATYLQTLIRTHTEGARLNGLLPLEKVRPDLPPWVTDEEP